MNTPKDKSWSSTVFHLQLVSEMKVSRREGRMNR
jgi:hypothetical protein